VSKTKSQPFPRFPRLPRPFDAFNIENILPTPNEGSAAALPDNIRRKHVGCFGLSGAGKSRLTEFVVVSDAIRNVTGHFQRGTLLIDITGDLYRNVRIRLAIARLYYPKLDELIVLVDPTNPGWSIQINPLELMKGDIPERKADKFANLVLTISHSDPNEMPRLFRVSYHSFLALILAGRTLVDMPEFLTNRDFREDIVSRLHHKQLSDFWFKGFPRAQKGERDQSQMIESTLNRLWRFQGDPGLAFMFGGTSTINPREIMDKARIVLVNADKGVLGEGTSYLLSTFLVSAFEQAGYTRSELPDEQRTPYSLFLDEFTNYVTEATLRIIAQSRKYGLELFLISQSVQGTPATKELLKTAVETVGSLLTFRLGYSDASLIAPHIFTPSLDQVKATERTSQKPFSDEKIIWRPWGETIESATRLITQLPDQQFWWKIRGKPGAQLVHARFVADLKDLPVARYLPRLLAQQEEAAFQLVGRERQPGQEDKDNKEIDAEISFDDEDELD
jgi:hypothetical protein